MVTVALLAAAAWYWGGGPVPAGDARLAEAFENRTSGLAVGGARRVQRVLADDLHGSRHQRFILELASGQTLEIAHNIDLAPRIGDLRAGDAVAFRGRYEWNARGGGRALDSSRP
jgi:hypothetical protein